MKTFYFEIDHHSIAFAEITASCLQDAITDLRTYIKKEFGAFSPVRIKGSINKPLHSVFWRQHGDPDWIRLGRLDSQRFQVSA